MKKFILYLMFGCAIQPAAGQITDTTRLSDTLLLQNIEVLAIRASDKAPFAKTNLSKNEISSKNLGYDLPFVLDQMPSVITGSDAGNGVGYTNLRIRGSDASRINVTLNGIPFNDAESQETFFVNMPDISSSVESIQVQRGVGTSSNGSGAFGATINLSTNEFNATNYAELNNAYGSFNTWKNTLKAGTGLINGHFTIDMRLSNITSDGYVDRATSDLKSFLASAAYLNKKTSLRFNIISGKEKTYQAWNGVSQDMLKTNRTYNSAGTEKPGTPYENETDNYNQTHYQLFLNQKVRNDLSFSIGTFLVRGKGYYENYKASQKFEKYGLPDLVIGSEVFQRTDLILQRWLDNYFYGTVFSLQYLKGNSTINFGGGYSLYDGDHFNRVIWAQQGFTPDYSSYLLPAHKRDFNLYAKWMYALGSGFNLFADVQQRMVRYEINGFKDNPDIYVNKKYTFLNPKAGLSYVSGGVNAYASFAVAVKEPNRKDFEAGINQIPVPEKMYDWEAGISYTGSNYTAGVNLYWMQYRDQLVNTGQINDVGAYTRTNVPQSYRAGIELQGVYKPTTWLRLSANSSFSRNKIKDFTEYIYDENYVATKNHFTNTDISFSPNVVAGGMVTVLPFKNAEINFISKYVGKQFLDNTSDQSRMVSDYFVENLRLNYTLSKRIFKQTDFIFQINNLFDRMYEANGYTFNYLYEGKLYVENYYFPMAGINFTAGINVRL